MHSINYMIIDMMLVDTPRILTEDEKKSLKKRNNLVKVNTMEEMEQQLKQMFK